VFRTTTKIPSRRHVLGAGALLAALLLAPPARSAESAPAPNDHLTRPQKIAQLAADLGYGGDTKHVGAAVPYLAAQIAPDDVTWNDAHRRWAPVCALIARELREDAAESFAESNAAAVDSAIHALSDGVVSGDLDAALDFFGSPVGRRFLELQRAMTDLSIEVSLAKEAPATGVNVENLDARKRVFELWLPIVFLQSMYAAHSADRLTDAAYQKFTRLGGAKLDAFARLFANELPQFEAFTKSAAFMRIMEAQKSAGQQTSAPNLAEFFATEVKRHGSEWRTAYARP